MRYSSPRKCQNGSPESPLIHLHNKGSYLMLKKWGGGGSFSVIYSSPLIMKQVWEFRSHKVNYFLKDTLFIQCREGVIKCYPSSTFTVLTKTFRWRSYPGQSELNMKTKHQPKATLPDYVSFTDDLYSQVYTGKVAGEWRHNIRRAEIRNLTLCLSW